jgi:hypothetical protein
MKKLILPILLTFLLGCNQYKQKQGTYPCIDGNCQSNFWVSTPSTSKQDANGYWHVKFWGPNYFTIKGSLSPLASDYVINGVPLIETGFDSDYWIFFDTIRYKYPVYQYMGLYSDKQFKNPISIGDRTYTLVDIANQQSPTNIVGYQITPYFCFTCGYTPDLLCVHSKYTYAPQCNVFFSKDMIGDTANIFMRTEFNDDAGEREVRNNQMKIVFE